MVRLLHFADLHLGAESYGRFNPETGLSTRLDDFLAALDRVTDYALNNDIHLVLFAGDAYKTCDPSPTHQREFARRIGSLGRAGIPTVLLTGNHDVPNARGRANTVEIFEALEAENVYVASRPQTLRLDTRGGPVQIVTLPWFNRSALLAKDEHRNETLEEVEETIIQKLERIVAGEVEGLNPDAPAVFLAHGSVFGAVYSSERKTILGRDPMLPAGLCNNPAFDYVALGHIHKHQALNAHPPVVYSGSVERIDFGEEAEEKGFVVAEVSHGQADWRFVPSQARRFVTIRVEANEGDPMEAIQQALASANVAEAVVRVIIQTKPELEPLIDERELRRLLKDAFHVAAVIRDVERPSRLRLGSESTIAALVPRDLLERYFQYRELPPDRIEALLVRADALMEDKP
jgi:DNA repair protein SbcD/Mre11